MFSSTGNTPKISSLAIEKLNESDSTTEVNGMDNNQAISTEIRNNGADGDAGDSTITNGDHLPVQSNELEQVVENETEGNNEEKTKLMNDERVENELSELNNENTNTHLDTNTELVNHMLKPSNTQESEVCGEISVTANSDDVDDLSQKTTNLSVTDDAELKVELLQQENNKSNEVSLISTQNETKDKITDSVELSSIVKETESSSKAFPEVSVLEPAGEIDTGDYNNLVTEALQKEPSPPKASPLLLRNHSTENLEDNQTNLKTAATDLSMSQDELDESLNSYDPSTPLAVRTNKLVTVAGEPMKSSPSANKNEPAADMNVVHVKISHKRQGSNVSIASLTERCREIKGEAIEHHATNIPSSPTSDGLLLGRDDTLEANIQQHTEPLTVEHHHPHSHDESDDDGKLYPISPFPPPQTSIYSQRSVSLSEFSLEQTQELGDEDEKLLEEMMDYDRIDVQNDLIESIDSITDIEDNDSPVDINDPDSKRKYDSRESTAFIRVTSRKANVQPVITMVTHKQFYKIQY